MVVSLEWYGEKISGLLFRTCVNVLEKPGIVLNVSDVEQLAGECGSTSNAETGIKTDGFTIQCDV
ncbi:MAG: hypothetical protein NPIRA01_16570 [Nitrospirales bacterium]|nr:MAG: hypothetical protein NPIRA01_16570 [Nitrospirales bacterium]